MKRGVKYLWEGEGGDGHNTRRGRREKRKEGKEIEKDIKTSEISKCVGKGREEEEIF